MLLLWLLMRGGGAHRAATRPLRLLLPEVGRLRRRLVHVLLLLLWLRVGVGKRTWQVDEACTRGANVRAGCSE